MSNVFFFGGGKIIPLINGIDEINSQFVFVYLFVCLFVCLFLFVCFYLFVCLFVFVCLFRGDYPRDFSEMFEKCYQYTISPDTIPFIYHGLGELRS